MAAHAPVVDTAFHRKPVVAALGVLLVAILGGLFTGPNVQTWYVNLEKPSFTPPNQVFGPVWTVLYLLVAASFFIARREANTPEEEPLFHRFANVFWVQLGLNLAWSMVFFGMHQIDAALAVIGALWLSILAMIVIAWKWARWASYLNLPYLLWVSYATALNVAISNLN
jgi:benzodiazapine receptor